MAGSDDLHPLLKQLIKSTNKVKEEVIELTGEVKKVRETLKEGFQSISDAIKENIQAQAELKMMEHVMEVEAIEPQIDAEEEQIEIERAELDERLENIDERYEQRHAELDQKAEERIRELGDHIFQINEEQFEDGIEKPFVEQVTTAWETFQSHNVTVKEERNERITDTTDSVVESIQDFIDRQESLVEEIHGHRHTSGSIVEKTTDEVRQLQFPYYVVTYEVDGVTKRDVVAPSHLSTAENDNWCGAELSSIGGADRLLDDADGVSEGNVDYLSSDRAVDIMSEYGETSFGQSYADVFGKTLPDRVPVQTTGGED